MNALAKFVCGRALLLARDRKAKKVRKREVDLFKSLLKLAAMISQGEGDTR